ncbi:MAG: hypothetical protein WBB27_11870 [Maribacter sp.]
MKVIIILALLSINYFSHAQEMIIGEYSSHSIYLHYMTEDLALRETKIINLTQFEGYPTLARFNALYGNSPVQFSKDRQYLIISLTENNEMEGIAYWTKFIRYDFKNQQFNELKQINHTTIDFWSLLNDNQIIGVSGKILFDYNVSSGIYDTVYTYESTARPIDIIESNSFIEILTEGNQEVISTKINKSSREVNQYSFAPISSYSSLNKGKMLTVEGSGSNVLKLRKNSFYSVVSVQKNLDISSFNSFWDSENNIYLTTKSSILKLNDDLNTIDKITVDNPHIIAIQNDLIIFSTRKTGTSTRKSQFYGIDSNFQKQIELTFLDANKTLILVK